MIKNRISVDLPSVVSERRKTLFDELKELFGVKVDLRTSYEETTVSAFSLVDGVCNALSRAQVNDAISLIVDKKVIYLDTQNVTSDMTLLWQAAERNRVFEQPFDEMHVAFAHREAGLYVIIDVRVQRRVVMGSAEMTVDLSARPEAIVVQSGESARSYAERVTRYARDEALLTSQRVALDGVAQRIAWHLRQTLPGSRVDVPFSHVELVRPESRQLRRLGHLRWGAQATPPHYRPVPTQSRSGAYADSFGYYWYDPYWDFTHYLLLDAVLHHGGWHSPEVVVVNPQGERLFSADQAAPYQDDPWVGSGLVSVGDHGVGVSESLPPDTGGWGGSDVGASPSGEPQGGWGGSDVHDHGWGGSDTSSSDGASGSSGSSCSSSSSCGSSCSGSSCGSSCGGGGGD